MEKLIHNNDERNLKFTFRINTLLLMTHICLLGLFTSMHVNIMVCVNIVSILIYCILYFYYKKNIVQYVFIVCLEVLVHMSVATLCVGWDAGFQFYSFCLIPCIFLCDYMSKTDGGRTMHPVCISVITGIVFLASRLYCVEYGAIYQVASARHYIILFAFNALVTFFFLVIYMWMYEQRILQKEKQLADMAELDELTKLPNRYLMREWLREGYRMSTEQSNMAAAILDIDDFKGLNDTYGHICGDAVLKSIAASILSISNERLRVCRWGGEEFVCMTTGQNAYDYLIGQLEELRIRIEESRMSFQNQEMHVTITIGAAEYSSNDNSYHEILQRADEALYEGKKQGKNCLVGRKTRT